MTSSIQAIQSILGPQAEYVDWDGSTFTIELTSLSSPTFGSMSIEAEMPPALEFFDSDEEAQCGIVFQDASFPDCVEFDLNLSHSFLSRESSFLDSDHSLVSSPDSGSVVQPSQVLDKIEFVVASSAEDTVASSASSSVKPVDTVVPYCPPAADVQPAGSIDFTKGNQDTQREDLVSLDFDKAFQAVVRLGTNNQPKVMRSYTLAVSIEVIAEEATVEEEKKSSKKQDESNIDHNSVIYPNYFDLYVVDDHSVKRVVSSGCDSLVTVNNPLLIPCSMNSGCDSIKLAGCLRRPMIRYNKRGGCLSNRLTITLLDGDEVVQSWTSLIQGYRRTADKIAEPSEITSPSPSPPATGSKRRRETEDVETSADKPKRSRTSRSKKV